MENFKVETEKIKDTTKIVGKMDVSKFNKNSDKIVVIKRATNLPQNVIHFFTGKDKKVVGRTENGKIAIISYDFKGQWVKEGEDWICDIIKEDEKKIVVIPVKLVKNADDNMHESLAKLKELQTNGFKQLQFTQQKDAKHVLSI